ncbi:hypothetical protein NXC24_PC01435 (plasmid) [Rhizobium sp. NXC24]|nr:hypothetical protein NXC24_PC01435 [Rhizobium sp. NXC24]
MPAQAFSPVVAFLFDRPVAKEDRPDERAAAVSSTVRRHARRILCRGGWCCGLRLRISVATRLWRRATLCQSGAAIQNFLLRDGLNAVNRWKKAAYDVLIH